MATEPMTLFARIADPAAVARLLREKWPAVAIDGPDDAWANAVVTLGERAVRFTHDPAYYEEPNWSVHVGNRLLRFYGNLVRQLRSHGMV